MAGKSDIDKEWDEGGAAVDEPTMRTDLSEMLALAESVLHKAERGRGLVTGDARPYNRTSSGVRPINLPHADGVKTAAMPVMTVPDESGVQIAEHPAAFPAPADIDGPRTPANAAPPRIASRPVKRRRGARLLLLIVATSALCVLGSAFLPPAWVHGVERRVLQTVEVARSTIERHVR